MRSARPLIALSALALVVPLAGCVSTERRNERAKMRATRLLASRQRLVVGAPNPAVRVRRVTLLRGGRRGAAIVAELANVTPRAVTDLPVAIGVRARGRVRWLNHRGGLDYLETHVPSVPAASSVHWVFTTRTSVPAHARALAVVGAQVRRLGATPASLPRLRAEVTAPAARSTALAIQLHNESDVPQYGLPVYALATRHGRLVAAGRAAVEHLGSSGSTTVHLQLVGRPAGATVEAEALPSIFR